MTKNTERLPAQSSQLVNQEGALRSLSKEDRFLRSLVTPWRLLWPLTVAEFSPAVLSITAREDCCAARVTVLIASWRLTASPMCGLAASK